MYEKEIVEVFVHVQEPKYCDEIMLLVGEKYTKTVKVGETMEDDLKTGKITHATLLPGSSGLLKKKREYVSVVLMRRIRLGEVHHHTMVVFDLHRVHNRIVIHKLIIKMLLL